MSMAGNLKAQPQLSETKVRKQPSGKSGVQTANTLKKGKIFKSSIEYAHTNRDTKISRHSKC